MFVTNHVLAGASIGARARRPATAFAAGVVSHLVMDALPHWGGAFEVGTPEGDERFFRVARRDGLSALTAMAAAALLADSEARPAVVAAMAGGAVVDMDKPFRFFLGFDPFPAWFSRFHKRIQNESPRRLPLELALIPTLAAVAVRSLA